MGRMGFPGICGGFCMDFFEGGGRHGGLEAFVLVEGFQLSQRSQRALRSRSFLQDTKRRMPFFMRAVLKFNIRPM
jgi:hypothetical protein